MGVSTEYIIIRSWLAFSISCVSFVCSMLTLLTIKNMKVWNGNMLLITTMTVFQVFYDVNFLMQISQGYASCVTWIFLAIVGGLGVAFATNVISFTVIYVVINVKSLNVFNNYPYFMIFVGVAPLVFAICSTFVVTAPTVDDDLPFQYCVFDHSAMSTFINDVYYWGRFGSIIFNFVVFLIVSLEVKHLTAFTGFIRAKISNVHSQSTTAESQSLAVFTLASRLKYYPLAQALSRAGSAWNEYDNYKYSTNISTVLSAICSPLSGILYFIVFLVMQPKAWKTFKKMFRFPTNKKNTNNEREEEEDGIGEHGTGAIFRGSFQDFDDAELENIINDETYAINHSLHFTMNPMSGRETTLTRGGAGRSTISENI